MGPESYKPSSEEADKQEEFKERLLNPREKYMDLVASIGTESEFLMLQNQIEALEHGGNLTEEDIVDIKAALEKKREEAGFSTDL